MRESEAGYARNQSEKLRLHQKRNCLRTYETLYLHESSTASHEDRALAEAMMRSLFLETLGISPGRADGVTTAPPGASPTHAQPHPIQAGDYADAHREDVCTLSEAKEEGPSHSESKGEC
jgi:hypothetical protein